MRRVSLGFGRQSSALLLALLAGACSADPGSSGDGDGHDAGQADEPRSAATPRPPQGLPSVPAARPDDPVTVNRGAPLAVRLRSRDWAPSEGVDALLAPAVADAEKAGHESVRVFAQRRAIPTLEEWQKLASAGLTPESYLGDLTWVLRLPTARASGKELERLIADFGAIAVSPVLPSDKTDAATLAGRYEPWAFDAAAQRLSLRVSLYDDASPDQRERFMQAALADGTPPEVMSDGDYAIKLVPERLSELLALPAVRFVEQGPVPQELLMGPGLKTTGADLVQKLVAVGNVAEYAGYTGRGVRVSNGWEGTDGTHDDFWNHDEAGARTTRRFTPTCSGNTGHGAMTSGLLMGNGYRSVAAGGAPYQFRGMAPEALFVCDNEESDVSSHSYVDSYGSYGASQAAIDRNIRGDGVASRFHPAVGSAANQGIKKQYGVEGGYYSIYRVLKNEITVGSIATPDLRWLETSIGPTFDGRLKPDIVAPAGATVMPDRLANLPVDIDAVWVERGGSSLVNYSFDVTGNNWLGGWGSDGWWDRANVSNFSQLSEGSTKAFHFTINPMPWGWAWNGYPMVATSLAPDGTSTLNITGAANDVVKVRYRTANVPEWNGSPLLFKWSDKAPSEARYYNLWQQDALLESDGNWHTASFPVGSNANWASKPSIQYLQVYLRGPIMPSAVGGNGYQASGGSSAAAPVVGGGVALLMEQFQDRHGVVMGSHSPSPLALASAGTGVPLPSTFKAILLHTARDLASIPRAGEPNNPDTGAPTAYHRGPDLVTGYGALDIAAATRLVAADADARAASLPGYLLENTLTTSAGDHFTIDVTAGQPLKVTLAWDDAPGDPASAEVVPKLVNNLDLLLKGPDGLYYMPYSLDQPYVPGSVAEYPSKVEPEPITAASIRPARQDRPNNRDNVEQVYVENPPVGQWHVYVLPGGLALPPQKYSLVLGTPPVKGALDTGRVAFLSDRAGGSQIFVKDLDAGTLTQLTTDAPEKGIPKISPDGNFVIATSGPDLKVWNMSGAVVATFTAASYGLAGFRYPSWSPDGSKISFSAIVSGSTQGLRMFELSSPYVFTNPATRVLVPTGTTRSTYESEFTPDGTQLYVVADESGVPEKLFRVDLVSGAIERFYVDGQQPKNANWPSVSPDGRTVLVDSRNFRDDPVGFPLGEEILEYGQYTGVSRRVTNEPFDQNFATYARHGSGELALAARDGTGRSQLYLQNEAQRILLDVGDAANSYNDDAPSWWKPRPNLARTATITASTNYGGSYSPAKTGDGNRDTTAGNGWVNAAGVGMPQWLQLDFGADRTFSKVELFTSKQYELRDYDIEYLSGGVWKKAVVVNGNVAVRRQHDLGPVTSRFLRVLCRYGSAAQSTYARINEIEVY